MCINNRRRENNSDFIHLWILTKDPEFAYKASQYLTLVVMAVVIRSQIFVKHWDPINTRGLLFSPWSKMFPFTKYECNTAINYMYVPSYFFITCNPFELNKRICWITQLAWFVTNNLRRCQNGDATNYTYFNDYVTCLLRHFTRFDASSVYCFIGFRMTIDLTKAAPPEQIHKAH